MKTLLFVFAFLMSFMTYAQFEADKYVTISKKQNDDVYLAGEDININAQVDGDAVIAGSSIVVRDTISQDLLVAGGDINVKGYIRDDIRAAGGRLIIDTVVGDDVIIFGGEVLITEDAIILGNLITFSGTIKVNGKIMGLIKAYGGNLKINGTVGQNAELYADDLYINGEIKGTSILVAEHIEIGDVAKFYDDVEYWSKSKEIDFKKSLLNATATYKEDLARDKRDFPWQFFGVAAIGLWIFYMLSAFLIILIINALFRNLLLNSLDILNKNVIKSFGYGLVYLIGLPILIIFCFVILIGIPIGLLLGSFYLFSVLIGHLIVALLIAHYVNKKNGGTWGLWPTSFLALGIALVLRLITLIPFLGFAVSLILIAIAYGLIALVLLNEKPTAIINKEPA